MAEPPVVPGTAPLTGLRYDPADPGFVEDPYPHYRWLREVEPVHRHRASGAWLLSRFEDVWSAAQDWRRLASGSALAALHHMASSDPPQHDRLRAWIARAFTARAAGHHAALIRGICRELLDPLAGAGRVDFAGDFAQRYSSRVIQRVLGIPGELEDPLRESALAIASSPDAAAMARELEHFGDLVREALGSLRRPRHAGLLEALRSAGAGGPGPAERCGLAANLILAGTDTTGNLLANGLVLLARHPAVRARLARHPAELRRAVEEMLRFESPVQSLGRRARVDVELHGVTIPAGAEVRLLWGAANRDEREFPGADRFDIQRLPQRHLAFGHGIHVCVGAQLARLVARIAFEELLARWPEYELDQANARRIPSFWARGYERLPVVLGRSGRSSRAIHSMRER